MEALKILEETYEIGTGYHATATLFKMKNSSEMFVDLELISSDGKTVEAIRDVTPAKSEKILFEWKEWVNARCEFLNCH